MTNYPEIAPSNALRRRGQDDSAAFWRQVTFQRIVKWLFEEAPGRWFGRNNALAALWLGSALVIAPGKVTSVM